MAVFALIRNPNRQSWIYFGFSICVVGWAFFSALWLSQLFSLEKSLLYARIAHAFAVFIPITWFTFVMEFLDQKPPFKNFFVFNYSISFVLSFLSQTNVIVSGMHSMPGIYFFTSPGKLYWVYVLLFYSLVPYGFMFLIKALRKSSGVRRTQIHYFMVSTIVAFAAGSTMFPPVFKIQSPLILLTLMPLYPFLAGVSLIRYGLFDFYEMADTFRRDKLAAIGTLATSLNHEIRNPLYVIQGLSESHLENVEKGIYTNSEQLIEKSNFLFKKISIQAKRAMDIMKRFALFAKRGVSHQPVKEKVFLRDALDNILPLIRYELELEKIELNRDIPENLSPINIDPRHFEEILFNLIVNSCHALKQKEDGRINIKTHEDSKKLIISISDNGPGIPENQIKKIFDPFYTTKSEGTGLGLYITKQLVEGNNGKIKVESKLDEGTAFVLNFSKSENNLWQNVFKQSVSELKETSITQTKLMSEIRE